jgi:two-component system CheB/CheR fusion protein
MSRARRILIVDDNKDSAESLAMLLGMVGNEVWTAHDGKRALEVARECEPDLVLLDIGLPGMNGYEVAQRLKAEPTLGKVVLAALTGFGTEEDRQLSHGAGFDHHLVKPVNLDDLQRLLAALDHA